MLPVVGGYATSSKEGTLLLPVHVQRGYGEPAVNKIQKDYHHAAVVHVNSDFPGGHRDRPSLSRRSASSEHQIVVAATQRCQERAVCWCGSFASRNQRPCLSLEPGMRFAINHRKRESWQARHAPRPADRDAQWSREKGAS